VPQTQGAAGGASRANVSPDSPDTLEESLSEHLDRATRALVRAEGLAAGLAGDLAHLEGRLRMDHAALFKGPPSVSVTLSLCAEAQSTPQTASESASRDVEASGGAEVQEAVRREGSTRENELCVCVCEQSWDLCVTGGICTPESERE